MRNDNSAWQVREEPDFGRSEEAGVGFREVAELKGADGDANKAEHVKAERGEEPAEVAVFAFVEEDFEPGVALALAEGADVFGAEGIAFRGADAGEHPCDLFRRGVAGNLDVIGLVQMGGGVGNGVGPLGVVGKEEEALASLIEAADGDDAGQIRSGAQTLEDGAAALFVRLSDDEAGGFVEHEVNESLARDGLAINFDARMGEIETSIRITFHAAIEADAPSLNDLKGLSTRTASKLRQRASQADRCARHVVSIA